MATATPVLPKLVGERVKRREDPRLIQGRGTYVDDLKVAGMLHLAFKRSDIAHGRITSIDTSAAETMDGVEAVYTGADIAKVLAPMPIGTPFPSPPHHAVAVDVVRYAGEPVAVVVASDRYLARDAADAIVVDVRSAAGRSSIPKLAMTGKPGVIHADFPNNLAVALVPSGTGVAPDFSTIDNTAVDKAFADAEVVISQRMVNHRLVPNAMEPRGVVAHWEPGKDTMTIWSSTQNPHILQDDDRGDERPRPAPGPRHRAGSGRRLRREDQHLRRGVRLLGGLEEARHADQVDRGSIRSVRRDDARARHHRLHRRRGAQGRQGARPEDAADRRHRRLQHAAHRGDSDADDVDGERHLRHPGDPHDADRGLHQQDADRRLSRRRPSRGDLLRRARDGHAGARAEDGSRGAAAEELHPVETSSRIRRRWARSTTRATTRRRSTRR